MTSPPQERSFFSLRLLNNAFPSLHGYRAIAILVLIQFHIAYLSLNHDFTSISPAQALSINAWFALDLFFIVTGVLNGFILIQNFKNNPHSFFATTKRFYFRRSFRVFPLYYVVFFSYYFINKFISINPNFSTISFHELLYLTNYPYAEELYLMPWSWTLSVDEHFYLLCPILIGLLFCLRSHRARLVALAITWCCGFFVRLFIYFTRLSYGDLFKNMYAPTHARFDILVAGLGMAYLIYYYHDSIVKVFQRPPVRYLSIIVPLGIFSYILSPSINPHPFHIGVNNIDENNYSAFCGVFYYGTLTSIAFFPLLLCTMYSKSSISHFLGAKIFRKAATLSYGVYLVHLPIGLLTLRFTSKFILPDENYPLWFFTNFLIVTFFSFLLAYILHLLVEKPAMYVRDRYWP